MKADATPCESGYDDLPLNHVARTQPPAKKPTHLLSCFRRGNICDYCCFFTWSTFTCWFVLP